MSRRAGFCLPLALALAVLLPAQVSPPAGVRTAAGSTPAPALAATAHEMNLVVGRGELLQFPVEIHRVAVAEPKVADAVVVSPNEVMVNAKGVGKTTLVIWQTGAAPLRWDLTVREDGSGHEQFLARLRENIPGSTIDATVRGDTIVLTGKVKDDAESRRAAGLAASQAKNVINLLETPPKPEPRQIMLQVKFASVDRVALSEMGFNMFSRNDKMIGETTTQQFQTPRFSQLQFQNQTFSNATVNFADLLNLFAFRPDLNIGATIKALAARNLLQILAEPNLITLEGKEASFLAGGSFPFPVLTTTSTGGAVSPVITVQFRQFGVQLNFTPTIQPDGAIHLKVAPEVSSLDYSNAVTLQGFLIPALAQRRAETEVLLRDGESFAIAGLIDNRVVQTINKVRGFGDVPVLGHLFRSRSNRKSTDELLVVITPHFVRPLSAAERAKLPDFPETFLPAVNDQKTGKRKPEYTGPRGYQTPKP